MSQNYIVTSDDKEKVVTISTKKFEKTDVPAGHTIVSAGTVTFHSGGSTVIADVTHGSLLLGVTIDLNQMVEDQKLIQSLFT